MARHYPFRYGRAGDNTASAVKPMSDSVPFGFRDVEVGSKQALVDDVFDSVARRYDLMNDLMSGGLHRLWKSAMVSALNPPRRGGAWRLIDAAGGTGDIALRVAERCGGQADIVVADTNASMLQVGRERAARLGFAHWTASCISPY